MHRFFLPPAAIHGQQVTLPDEITRQIRSVLRLHPGDEIEVRDGQGLAHRVALQHLGKKEGSGRILETWPAGGEPAGEVILCLAIIRGDRFEWTLQKGVELGVTRFQPLLTQRTVRAAPGDEKWQRWQRIVREAAEQSGRGRLPRLAEPQSLDEALAARQGLTLFPALAANTPISTPLAQPRWPLTLFVGPEGGFAPAEVALAQAAGVEPVGLGPRVLRTETAAILLLTLALAALGEFDRPTPGL